ncbi:hypothetical protein C8D88_102864 [Lentzea atacamensis]|uniref:Uncharacterized protein n=1 Tax=Lentzea atacamensis TaxID=531938 RepID=A0A316I972_9PSEU|nr:hypothetical protein C8D88_102864 [Lentzea atacamensis]RAS60631.1 hypothetical protein C8D87_11149 [Lentzea atacamensis]
MSCAAPTVDGNRLTVDVDALQQENPDNRHDSTGIGEITCGVRQVTACISVPPSGADMAERKKPGATQFTRARPRNSRARLRQAASSPALAAAYRLNPG